MKSSITSLNPASLNQLLTTQAGQILAEHLPASTGLVSVTGNLSDPGMPRGQWHYGVRLTDDGGRVLVDLPVSLVSGKGLQAGQSVTLTGIIRIRQGQQAGTLELRIEASNAEILAEEASLQVSTPVKSEMALAPEITTVRHEFPETGARPLHITMIQSSSRAQVAEDCLSELEKLGSRIQVTRLGANMLEPGSIVSALDRAAGDIVLLIRGGGDEADFEVFNDHRVVNALARHSAYRVIGLGHSANHTALDRIADHAARTPGQAGMHIREMVLKAPVAVHKAQSAPTYMRARVPARRSCHQFTSYFFKFAIPLAGLVGIVLVLKL